MDRSTLRSMRLAGWLWGLLFLAAGPAVPAGLPSRPNLLVVITDDQGYGDLSCHGNPVLRTPALDRLHAESVRFTRFHVSPTCAPTRAALLTGRHEFRNGVTHTIHERERLRLDAVTLADVLRRGGYATGIFGKWHLGDEAPHRPDRRGFQEVFIHGAGGIGQSYPGSCGDAPGNTYHDPWILHNGRFVKTRGYCTDVFFNQAEAWIGRRAVEAQPFFALLALNVPHAPLICPEAYEARYRDRVPPDTARFFGMIAHFDERLGGLLDRLRAMGLEEKTVVIFLTDNGGTTGVSLFNAGMRGTKGTPFSGGTRVPSFWRWPGVLKPGAVDRLTAHIDLFPTLSELAGVRLTRAERRQMEGRSLVPLLSNPAARWPERHLVTHVGRWERGMADASKYSMVSVRNSRFLLVNPVWKGEQWQLFDLSNDPGERTNVLAEFPREAARMKKLLDSWWREVRPHLVNEEAPPAPENAFKTLFREQFGQEALP